MHQYNKNHQFIISDCDIYISGLYFMFILFINQIYVKISPSKA